MQTPEIAKMLVLSTWHLNYHTAVLFDTAQDAGVAIGDDHMVVYEKGQWGYIVPILDDMPAGLPADLIPVIDYANSHGCDWLMFDRDAGTIDELPTHEW